MNAVDTATRAADEALAAEYALQMLPAIERRPFENRLAGEPQLRAMVRDWSEALSGLADTLAPVDPPPSLRARIGNRLFRREAGPEKLSAVRFLGGVAFGAALGLALVALVMITSPRPVPARFDPAYEAVLAGANAGATVLISEGGRYLGLADSATPPPFGRVYELWLLDGSGGVQSVGLLPGQPGTVMRVPEDVSLDRPGARLAISTEPPGGSSSGRITGPIVARGDITPVSAAPD